MINREVFPPLLCQLSDFLPPVTSVQQQSVSRCPLPPSKSSGPRVPLFRERGGIAGWGQLSQLHLSPGSTRPTAASSSSSSSIPLYQVTSANSAASSPILPFNPNPNIAHLTNRIIFLRAFIAALIGGLFPFLECFQMPHSTHSVHPHHPHHLHQLTPPHS